MRVSVNGTVIKTIKKPIINVGVWEIARAANIPGAPSTLENIENCKCHNGSR